MISSHIPKLLTIEQESSEVCREFVVRVQREYVRNVLVGADNDNRALLTVDAAQLEDVGTVLEVGAVGLLVVDKPEAPLARKQNRRELFDLEVAVPLLEDRCACRKSNPNILVVQPAQDRAAKNGPGQFDGAQDRRILLQRINASVPRCDSSCTTAAC